MADDLPPLVGTVEFDTEQANAALDELKASVASTTGEMDAALKSSTVAADESFGGMAAAADASKMSLSDVGLAASTAASDVGKAADDAGASMGDLEDASAGVADGVASDLGDAGMAMGNLRSASQDMAEGVAGDLDHTGSAMGDLKSASKDMSSGLANDLGDAGMALGGLGSHSEDAASDLDKLGEHTEDLGEKSEGLGEKVKGALSNLGIPESLLGGWTGAGVAIAGVGAVALDMASKMQSADTAIANSAGISATAAKKIGTAFLGTAGTTEFSGKEMAEAFATVAGQLKSTEGHALNAATSLEFMDAAMDLATAKQIALKTATSAVAGIMQSYQMRVKTAANVSDALFEASNATGQSITQVGQALSRTKTRLGGLAPTLEETSALLVDMTDHGESGRQAMSALTTAFTTFLKPASAVATAQNDLNAAMKSLTPQLQALAEGVKNGTVSVTALTKAEKQMTPTQKALWSTFTSANNAVTTAGEAYAKLGINALTATGKLRPLGTIIGQLHTKIKGESTAAATATLTAEGFGSSSAKLVKVIEAGTPAFEKATTDVTKLGTAHAAAAKEAGTLHVMVKTVEATFEDLVTELGQDLLPILAVGEHAFMLLLDDAIVPVFRGVGDLVGWFEKASPAALAVASIIGLALTPKLVSMGVAAATTFAETAAGWASSVAAAWSSSAQMAASAAQQVESWLGIQVAAEEASTGIHVDAVSVGSDLVGIAGHAEATQGEFAIAMTAMSGSMQLFATSLSSTAGTVTASTTEISGAFSSLDLRVSSSVEGMSTSASSAVGAAMQNISLDVSATAEEVEAQTGAMSGAFSGLGATVADTAPEVATGISGILGPVGLLAGGALIVGEFASHLFHLGSAGPTMNAVQASIRSLNQTIEQMPTTNVVALGTAIIHLTTDADKARTAIMHMTPGTTSFVTAADKIADLTAKTYDYLRAQAHLTANTRVLADTFHLTATKVEQFAQYAGVDLKRSLTTTTINQFRQALTASGTKAVEAAAKVKTANETIAQSGKAEAQSLLTSDRLIVTGRKTALATMVALSETTGAKAVAELVNATKGGLPALEAVDKAMGVDIPSKYMTLLKQNLTTGGFIAITGLVKAIDSQKLSVEEHMTGVVDEGRAMRRLKMTLHTGGTAAMKTLIAAIDSNKDKLSTHSESVILAAVEAVEKHKHDLGPVGKTLIEGLANGIYTGSSAAVNAAVETVNKAVAAAKAAAGIKSPSLVMASEVGGPMGQGVAVGIIGAEGEVGAAIHSVVKTALTPTQAGFAAAEAFGKEIAAAAATSFVGAFTSKANKAGLAAAAAWGKTLTAHAPIMPKGNTGVTVGWGTTPFAPKQWYKTPTTGKELPITSALYPAKPAAAPLPATTKVAAAATAAATIAPISVTPTAAPTLTSGLKSLDTMVLKLTANLSALASNIISVTTDLTKFGSSLAPPQGGGTIELTINIPVTLTGVKVAALISEKIRVAQLRGKGRQTGNILGGSAGRTTPAVSA